MFNTLSRDILKEILIRQETDEVVMEIKDFNFGKSSSTPLKNFFGTIVLFIEATNN